MTFGPSALLVFPAASSLIVPAAAGAGAVGYTATGNILIVRYIRVVNTTPGVAETFSLFCSSIGASGKEIITNMSITATPWEWRGTMRLDGTTTGVIYGYCTNGTAVLSAEGEVGIV